MSFSLKVILVLHLGPWKFWKLQIDPFSPSSVSPSLLSLTADSATPPAAALGRPRPTPTSPLLRAGVHASRPSSSTPSSFALDLPSLRHAPAEASRGCHLAAAVARAAQHPRPSSIARISTPGSSTTRSPRSLARSLPRLPKPAPPSTRNPGELDAAAGPPLQTPSACADPLVSSTVGPQSSPTRIAPLSLTGAP